MTSDLSAHQRKIKVAPQLISQVIYNLIQNGCHAMKSGQTLYLSTKETNNSVILMVSDQGSGIAEEFRDSIFKPFFTTNRVGHVNFDLCQWFSATNRSGSSSIRMKGILARPCIFMCAAPTERQSSGLRQLSIWLTTMGLMRALCGNCAMR